MDSKKWQPSGFIKASALAHAGAFAALAVPEAMAWGVGTLIVNHAALTAAGLWPRSSLLGPNILRLDSGRPEIVLTIDDGPDPEVTPYVLDILAEYDTRATFFCIADKAKAYPALVRKIIDAGHHVENHSMSHRHYFSLLGIKGLTKELSLAQETIHSLTGRLPQFFRAPAGLRNPFLDPVLHHLNLRLASWTRRGFDTRTSDPDTVLKRLLSNLSAGDILLLHDGNSARGLSGKPVILHVLPRLIEAVRQSGLECVRLEDGLETPSRSTGCSQTGPHSFLKQLTD
jgi:chitin deacetylase